MEMGTLLGGLRVKYRGPSDRMGIGAPEPSPVGWAEG